jgi:predicted nucleic acid-binding protein
VRPTGPSGLATPPELPSCDATYVVVAERLDAPLITLDRQIA